MNNKANYLSGKLSQPRDTAAGDNDLFRMFCKNVKPSVVWTAYFLHYVLCETTVRFLSEISGEKVNWILTWPRSVDLSRDRAGVALCPTKLAVSHCLFKMRCRGSPINSATHRENRKRIGLEDQNGEGFAISNVYFARFATFSV